MTISHHEDGRRIYYLDNEVFWVNKDIHSSTLIEAITQELRFRYAEKHGKDKENAS